jgi:phosphoribosylformylglycinamidine synthase
VTSAHDLSDGGLATAVVEAALLGDVGATISVLGDPFVALFSESTARAIVTTTDADAVLALAENNGIAARVIGRTTGDKVAVQGLFEVGLEELRTASEETLPALFG